jgi:hypothetical protein
MWIQSSHLLGKKIFYRFQIETLNFVLPGSDLSSSQVMSGAAGDLINFGGDLPLTARQHRVPGQGLRDDCRLRWCAGALSTLFRSDPMELCQIMSILQKYPLAASAALAIAVAAALSACGGGSTSGDTPASTPSTPVAPTPVSKSVPGSFRCLRWLAPMH